MIYLYIYEDCIKQSKDVPKPEEIESIADGYLSVIFFDGNEFRFLITETENISVEDINA